MAEKLTTQTGSDIMYPKERRISEKEDINFLTFDIDKVCQSEDESFKLTESDIPTWPESVLQNIRQMSVTPEKSSFSIEMDHPPSPKHIFPCQSYLPPIKLQFPPNKDHFAVLKRFGHDNFKDPQWKIISIILDFFTIQEPSRIIDQFFIASSGFGKSLCFQFVPVYLNSMALVISPLISLMLDQVRLMRKSGIPAILLSPLDSRSEKTLARVYARKYYLVYITPELCINLGAQFIEKLHTEVRICLVAIDEAHCVSSWGHDFRPKYGRLMELREWLPNVPFLGVTATSNEFITNDVIRSLKLRNPIIHRTSLNRPNLYFEIFLKSKYIESDMKTLLISSPLGTFKFNGPCIVFCNTHESTRNIAKILQNLGVVCECYNSSLSKVERIKILYKFANNEIECVVATVAFGMGLDKPDIRLIIHYGAPKEMETYIQGAGRAGRDGNPGRCVIFYSPEDFSEIRDIVLKNIRKKSSEIINYRTDQIQKVETFLSSNHCRRQQLLANLDEIYIPNPSIHCCDICTFNSQQFPPDSISEPIQALLTIRDKLAADNNCEPNILCSNVTIKMLADIQPSNMCELRNIDCVPNLFCDKYGPHFLREIESFPTNDLYTQYDCAPCNSVTSSFGSNLKRPFSRTQMDASLLDPPDNSERFSSSKRKKV